MNPIPRTLFALVVLLAVVLGACLGEAGTGEHQDPGSATTGREESGTELAPDETHDQVRNGARPILVFDPESNSFRGIVENTTANTLVRVRVEVHLSNGVESWAQRLRPTLAPVNA